MIKAIRQYHSGEETVTFNDIPSDLQFVKLHQYNDKQQFWMTMFLKDDELGEKLESLSSRSYTLGKLTIVYFNDIKFITEIPTCSIEHIKSMYVNELSGLYVRHISRGHELLRIYKVIDIIGVKIKISVVHFMSIIGSAELNCLDVYNIEAKELVSSPIGYAITSSGHWSECLYTDDIKTLYNDRIKYLTSF